MNKDESIRFAAKYLEDLLSFFGINVAVSSTIVVLMWRFLRRLMTK